MQKKILVLHLDDDPDDASWIPREIHNWFWKWFREDMRSTRLMEENDSDTDFLMHLKVLDAEIEVNYRIFADETAFYSALQAVGSEETAVALIILDQMLNSDSKVGGRVYQHISTNAPTFLERTLILTAYPVETCLQLQWNVDDQRLVAKPPVFLRIIEKFVGGVRPSVGIGAYTRLTEAVANEVFR